jgi:agmatinase
MSKQEKISTFNPNGIGLKNGHFIGLPFEEQDAEVVMVSVPWDVTVSYAAGTSQGPANILACSDQLDLFDSIHPEAWKMGIYFRAPNPYWEKRNAELRPLAEQYIEQLEQGFTPESNKKLKKVQDEINASCENLKNWVYQETKALLQQGKLVGIIGGEHSTPLGFLQALLDVHDDFGILQIDAHMDLRKAYEGFTYSHASIFYNALQLPISSLYQIGIRDYCSEEVAFAQQQGERVQYLTDEELKRMQFEGVSWSSIVEQIIKTLPQKVYVSFDIDGLSPDHCPGTGTPVPGGLTYAEAIYLLQQVVQSGRNIIGFDLCEVAGPPHEWDGNVGARVAYKLCNLMGYSNQRMQ